MLVDDDVSAPRAVLELLGLGEQAIAQGFAIQGSRFRDGEGNVLGAVPAPPLLGDRFPGMNGITRPRLHRIFQGAVRASGADVKLGITVERLDQDDDGDERGGAVSTALTGAPCGGPKSPAAEPVLPLSAAAGAASRARPRSTPSAPSPRRTRRRRRPP